MGENAELFEQLEPRQQKAVLALVENDSIRKVSQETEIPESTLYRWKQTDTLFITVLKTIRSEQYQKAVDAIQSACPEQVQVLRKIASDPKQPSTARVAASKFLIEQAIKIREVEQLLVRFERIERYLEEQNLDI